MKKMLTVLFLTVMPLFILCGAAPRVMLQPHSPVAGDRFMIIVEVDSDAPVQFQIPPVSGISISRLANSQHSNMRIINGKREVTAAYGFAAQADKPGQYTIPAMKITVDKEVFQTEPVTFTVRDPAQLTGPDDLTPDQLQLRMKIIPERNLYAGETAQAVWELIIPGHIRISGISDIQVSGLGDPLFILQGREKAKFVETSRRQTAKNGYGYTILEFVCYFQPQQPGKFDPRGKAAVSIAVNDGRSFFPVTRETIVRTAAKPLTVLPLPQAPASAVNTGLIGDWKLSFAPVDKELKSGEIAELTLNVSGTSQTEVFRAPELKITQARTYPPEVKRTADGFAVKYLFVPLKAGTCNLDFDLAVFDPNLHKYRIEKCTVKYTVVPGESAAASPAVPQTAVPDGSNDAAVVKDLPFYPREPGKKVLLPLIENTKWWALNFTVAGVILAVAGVLRHRRKKSDPAKRELQRKLNILIQQLDDSNDCAKTMRNYGYAEIASALQMPCGSTATEIAEKIDDPELKKFFRALDDSTFRPGGNTADFPSIREKLLRWLKKLALFLCILAVLPLSAEFNAGREAFDRGDYHTAEKHFRNNLDQMSPDANNYFNIGCSEYMAGDYPDASLAFEQSYLLMPDNGVKAAWEDSSSHLPGHEKKDSRNFADWLSSCRDTVRPDTYILWASVGIFLLGAMIFAGKFPCRNAAMVLVTLGIILALAAAWHQSCTSYSPDRARITAKQAEVRRLPLANGSVAAIIPGGTEVWITDVKDNWVQIKYHNGNSGWVSSGELKRVMPHGIW